MKPIAFTVFIASATALLTSAPLSVADEKHEKPAAAHHDVAAHGAATITTEILANDFFAAGSSVPAEIRLTGADGKPVTPDQLKVAHTKKIHLLIIDESLADYQHAHPDPTDTPGVYRFAFNPKFGGKYTVWADLVPTASGAQEYAKTTVMVKGDPAAAVEKVNTTDELGGTVEPLHFTLTVAVGQPLQAGKASLVKVRITSADGKDFAGLEPLMGAFAHMVGFTGSLDSVTHVHPMGKEPEAETERGGPELSFHVVPEKAGYLKLFLQTQIHGVNEFASFGFQVAPQVAEADKSAPDAASTLTAGQKTFLEDYEAARTALAADDFPATQKAAVALAGLDPQPEGAEALAKSKSLEDAREAFKVLSAEAAKVAAKQPGYFVMTCPMVKGGEWVQTDKRVANPYMGAAMLGCGSVKP